MYFPKPAINENDLAIIERGDTASHSIEAGQYVSWKGKLGKANAAILQGTTLDDGLFSYDSSGALNNIYVKTGSAEVVAGANNRNFTVNVDVNVDDYNWVISLFSTYSGVCITCQKSTASSIEVSIDAASRRKNYSVSTAFTATYVLVGIKK